MYFKKNDLIYNISKLPKDIAYSIIPYLYQCQSKKILHDVRHFSSSLAFVKQMYYRAFIENEPIYYDENDDVNWLINNMFIYANDIVATMHGYVDKMTMIFRRNYMLSLKKYDNNETITRYIDNSFETLSVTAQIKFIWGLFSIDERNECIGEWNSMLVIEPTYL